MSSEAAYLSWWLGSAPALAVEVLGKEVVEQTAAHVFRDTLARRTDLDWADGFRRACPVPETSADAYRLREVRLTHDLRVLAGIHFYGGDVQRPFVGVFAQTRDVSVDERRLVTPTLCDAFALFAPRATWWWVGGAEDDGSRSSGEIADQRLWLGDIAPLTGATVGVADLPFTLRTDATGESYDAYVQIFAAFVAANPAWEGRLARTTSEDYGACASAGGLFVAEADGAVAGVFAARPGEVRGVPGWLVEEELLSDTLRGRGLAPHLQRMALARLDATNRPLVLGTIDAANEPSWRTARRVGRADVGGWVFVTDPRRPASD